MKPAEGADSLPAGMPAELKDRMRCTTSPGRFQCQGASLKSLLVRAYGLRADQISGPPWMDSERYDIAAKVPAGSKPDDVNVMLQDLLKDRFSLEFHRVQKTMTAYVLTVAKGGHKLKPAQPVEKLDADALKARNMAQMKAMQARMAEGNRGPWRSFSMPSGTMAKLAASLAENLDGPVEDRTQLEGNFSYSVEWSPDSPQSAMADPAAAPRGPDLFQAVEQQLGLKLQGGKRQVDILVVDRAEKTPKAN